MSKPNKHKIRLSSFLLILCVLLFASFYGCGTGPDEGTGGGTTPTGTASLALGITSSVVSFGTPQTATALLRDANGAAMANAVVTFATANNLVVFTPTIGTALTDAVGNASIIVNAASFDSTGATSITASASVTSGGTTSTTVTSAPVGIAVNGAAVTINSLTLSQPSISAYGSSSVTAEVWINGAPATVPIPVTFTSPCVASGKAAIDTPKTTVSGMAVSTYTDNNCASATDDITASVTGSTKSVTINVALPAVSNIKFVSATPAIIGTTTSTLPKSSVVKFMVVDSNNNGKANEAVDFSLLPLSAPGGITLSPSTNTTNSNGEVTTTVTSGTIPTPLWVVAKVHSNPGILTQSNTLTVTTGLPTQNFFSLSVQTCNIEGWENDGVTSVLMIIASDRLGNPLPDGTAINFITSGSQIAPASCATTNGTCSTKFVSAESRPANGRVSILAYALGEKSFIDVNGNNSYDTGETFWDIGDPYVDANGNGQWDPGETFIASTTTGTSACLTQPGGGVLPASYSDVPSKQNTCTAAWGNNYVRRSAVLVLSGSEAVITPTTVAMASSCLRTFTFTLTDLHNNPMPAGTTIATGSNHVTYTPFGATTASQATVSIDAGSPVVNTCQSGGTEFWLTVEADCSAGIPIAYPHGTLGLKVTTPKGLVTIQNITVTP